MWRSLGPGLSRETLIFSHDAQGSISPRGGRIYLREAINGRYRTLKWDFIGRSCCFLSPWASSARPGRAGSVLVLVTSAAGTGATSVLFQR